MKQTVKPDSRGRLSLKAQLDLIGWVPGQGVEIDMIQAVDLPKKEKQRY